jgi:hypothetical protein
MLCAAKTSRKRPGFASIQAENFSIAATPQQSARCAWTRTTRRATKNVGVLSPVPIQKSFLRWVVPACVASSGFASTTAGSGRRRGFREAAGFARRLFWQSRLEHILPCWLIP